jgi:hypothetical protein
LLAATFWFAHFCYLARNNGRGMSLSELSNLFL